LKIKRRRESEVVGVVMADAPMAAHGGVEKLPYEGDGAFVVEGDMWKVSCNHLSLRPLEPSPAKEKTYSAS